MFVLGIEELGDLPTDLRPDVGSAVVSGRVQPPVRGNHGHASTQRLEQWQPKRFLEGRQRE